MAVAKKTSFQVQWLLSHDGKDYPAGETIRLSDDESTPLLESGVIKLAGDKNEH